MKRLLSMALAGLVLATAAHAKLPTPPMTDEAKAKAAEAAAKTAHGNKVANYQLCKSMDRTVAHYAKSHPNPTKPLATAPACVDPGPFVPPAAAAPAAEKKS
jgi:hypothetical protein